MVNRVVEADETGSLGLRELPISKMGRALRAPRHGLRPDPPLSGGGSIVEYELVLSGARG